MSLLSYANEKLHDGVTTLAIHPGRIQERLIAAFHDSLVRVPKDDMPSEAKEIWTKVWDTVTSLSGTDGSGAFQQSIETLTDDEAMKVARDILTVKSMVRSALG